jgi:hypothetical protein
MSHEEGKERHDGKGKRAVWQRVFLNMYSITENTDCDQSYPLLPANDVMPPISSSWVSELLSLPSLSTPPKLTDRVDSIFKTCITAIIINII